MEEEESCFPLEYIQAAEEILNISLLAALEARVQFCEALCKGQKARGQPETKAGDWGK